MPTLMEYLYRAEACLRLAEDTDQAYARDALLELAAKFQATAVQLDWTPLAGNEGARACLFSSMSAAPNAGCTLLDQCTNQAQELLLLWPAAGADQKSSDVNVGDLAA
jgi:hypothetical protein